MPGDPPPPHEESAAENRLLREEVAQQKAETEARGQREAALEHLKNRVSVAAIVLTTALSFIGNVKSDRSDAASGFKGASAEARRQGAELWAYYQTKHSEQTSLEIAGDAIRLDLARRGLSRDAPEATLSSLKLTSYEERLRDFDTETDRVFYRVQDLERQEDVSLRAAAEPVRAVFRYELGGKLITLALILLSVTILSSKEYLFWVGVALGGVGLLVALDGYLLLL